MGLMENAKKRDKSLKSDRTKDRNSSMVDKNGFPGKRGSRTSMSLAASSKAQGKWRRKRRFASGSRKAVPEKLTIRRREDPQRKKKTKEEDLEDGRYEQYIHAPAVNLRRRRQQFISALFACFSCFLHTFPACQRSLAFSKSDRKDK